MFEPNIMQQSFSKNLLAVEMRKPQVFMNKPLGLFRFINNCNV